MIATTAMRLVRLPLNTGDWAWVNVGNVNALEPYAVRTNGTTAAYTKLWMQGGLVFLIALDPDALVAALKEEEPHE